MIGHTNKQTEITTLSIYKFVLSVWVSVCLYPINVKTAEPIGPNFFVGHHVTTGFMNDKFFFKKSVLKVFNFVKKIKFLKIRNFFLKIRKIFFFFVLKCKQKEHVHN